MENIRSKSFDLDSELTNISVETETAQGAWSILTELVDDMVMDPEAAAISVKRGELQKKLRALDVLLGQNLKNIEVAEEKASELLKPIFEQACKEVDAVGE